MITRIERSLEQLFAERLFIGSRIFGRHPCPPVQGIDFGNGAQLGAEDVLETHFQRLARARRLPASRPVTVPVQVGDNLLGAITVLAPQLAPLTALAEDVAYALPPVQPAPSFRSSLHSALEQTHRQHAAQRALGTRLHGDQRAASWPLWARIVAAAAVGICCLALGAWLLAPKRRSVPSS